MTFIIISSFVCVVFQNTISLLSGFLFSTIICLFLRVFITEVKVAFSSQKLLKSDPFLLQLFLLPIGELILELLHLALIHFHFVFTLLNAIVVCKLALFIIIIVFRDHRLAIFRVPVEHLQSGQLFEDLIRRESFLLAKRILLQIQTNQALDLVQTLQVS